MSRLYNEMYLEDGMRNLGEMLDYAVNACGISIDQYWKLFLKSGVADEFGKGNPAYICGRSGTELVKEIFDETGFQLDYPEAQIEYTYSPVYWSGWILAYYQWYSGKSFREIYEYVRMSDICDMYTIYHEMAKQQFVDAIEIIISKNKHATNIQTLRRRKGYSQRLLAMEAGVNLRTLQQYETRAKDINKASVNSLQAIAYVLGCDIMELLE